MKNRYRFAALIGFCGTLYACNEMNYEPTSAEIDYERALDEARPLMRRAVRTYQRAEDQSVTETERAMARERLEKAVCPSVRVTLRNLRAHHARAVNPLLDPFAPPPEWGDVIDWCGENE